MDIKITNLGVRDRKEIEIDQHKNVYERLCNTTAWSEIYAYRHIPTIKPSSYEKIRTIAEKDLFCWGVDDEGNYWKKYKNYNWKKMMFEDQPKYGHSSSIVASRGQSYWTAEENGTIIGRDDEVPLNQMQRRMYDLNFKKTIYGCMRKRRKLTKKIFKNCSILFWKNESNRA